MTLFLRQLHLKIPTRSVKLQVANDRHGILREVDNKAVLKISQS